MRSAHYRILRSYKDTPHGPSDRIRTCGILLPKQARYQLRYTRILNYCVQGGTPGHKLYYTQGTQKKQSKVLTIQKIELKSMADLCMIALR